MLYTFSYKKYGRTMGTVQHANDLSSYVFIGGGGDICTFIYIYIHIYGYNLFVILYTWVVLVWMIEYRHPHLLLVMLIVKYR